MAGSTCKLSNYHTIAWSDGKEAILAAAAARSLGLPHLYLQ